jgi:ribonuclease D
MLDLAAANPQNNDELCKVRSLGNWHRQTYGNEILHILKK